MGYSLSTQASSSARGDITGGTLSDFGSGFVVNMGGGSVATSTPSNTTLMLIALIGFLLWKKSA
jgi:hypothetical protein